MDKARIAVLVSGGGTNLQALIDAQTSGIIHSGEITLVIANNAKAYALQRAANAGIATEVVLKKELGSQAAFEDKINSSVFYPPAEDKKSYIRIIYEQAAHYKRVISGEETTYKPYFFK